MCLCGALSCLLSACGVLATLGGTEAVVSSEDSGLDGANDAEAGLDAGGSDGAGADRPAGDSSGELDAAASADAAIVDASPDAARADAAQADAAAQMWHEQDFPCRVKIGIDNQHLQVQLRNFPLLLLLDPNTLRCQSEPLEAAHINVVSATGITRAFEVGGAQPSQAIPVWVNVPQIDPAGQETSLWLYFGGEASPTRSPSPVWDADHLSVWHLDALLDGKTYDSANDTREAVAVGGMGAGDVVNGQVGGGIEFDGSGQRLVIDDAISNDLDFGPGESFSYSLWVYARGAGGASDMPWYNGGSSTSRPGYDFELGDLPWAAVLSDGDENPMYSFSIAADVLIGQWHHLCAVVDHGSAVTRVYVDGVQVTVPSLGISTLDSLANTEPAVIGADSAGNFGFDGIVDEVRVVSRPLSEAWVRTDYMSMNGDLVSLGQVEPQP